MATEKVKTIRFKISPTKTLTLKRTPLYLDECKKLIAEMIKQSVRDYVNFAYSKVLVEQEIFEEAFDFLFDDECFVDWGGKERCLKDFLDILCIDIVWFREMIDKKYYKHWGKRFERK